MGETSTIAEEDGEDEVKREKKSVRFNEVVQRQVYRSNSSILGQKMKNQKKNQQKMRKRAERRASEGDTPSSTPDFKDSQKSPENSEVQNSEIDSGVASSMDEAPISKIIEEKNKANNHNSKKKNKKYKKFITILISFSTWISKKNFFAALFKNNF